MARIGLRPARAAPFDQQWRRSTVAGLISEFVVHGVERFAYTRVARFVDQPDLGHLPVPRRQLASRVKDTKMMISSNAPDSIVVKQSLPRCGVGDGSDQLMSAPP